jgi:integrase
MISVDDYLKKLKLANKSPQTIKGYQKVFKSFAEYLSVPVDNLHNHLSSGALVSYAADRIEHGKSPAGTQTNIRILSRFFKFNDIIIDELDLEVIKNPGVKDENQEETITGKALTTELLQRMMDQGNPHSRSIITALVSTGIRSGECSKLLLSDIGRMEGEIFKPDINGSVIKIRDSIAKGKVKNGKKTGGGYVFLNAEAREFLTEWLRERDAYIKEADIRAASLKSGPRPEKGEKDTRENIKRPAYDQRIWAISYTSMHRIFDRLYKKCDGTKGTYRNRCTLHSTRAYFRTHAVKTMSIDLTEKIMRHSSYLGQYIQIPDMEQQYHQGEASLYITRADHRIQTGELSQLRQKVKQLEMALTDKGPDDGQLERFKKFAEWEKSQKH